MGTSSIITPIETLLAEATEGPWHVSAVRSGLAIVDRGEMTVGAAHNRGLHGRGDPRANAQLMALAPDLARQAIAAEKLVEALRQIDATRYRSDTRQLFDCLRIARAALFAYEAAKEPA